MSPTYDVKDKVIAITGGASGIGLATAQLLASQGAKVSIADVQAKGLQDVASQIQSAGGTVHSTIVDVREPSQVESWISETVSRFGKLDGAANLAGVIPKCINIERVEELNEEDWKFTVDVNLTGVMHCLRAQIPNASRGASIVNAASVAGLGGFPKNAAYTAAKWGVIGLTKTAAKESFLLNRRGTIDTPMHRESTRIRGKEPDYKIPIARKGKAEEVANLIAFLLCDASSYMTGTVQVIDGATQRELRRDQCK
ncbi:NAD(P)-binding protein [Patellaria atrata CBS 101060]|uniref:NAD(P)-binding protein n=1 Tax=Patellaria atrata CBS 101060 TaxID=1346257 RepID=A0A9P4SD18_9PEZI|nr:NAD(P)-binding protein [Patellaria atrata CBS 101060]